MKNIKSLLIASGMSVCMSGLLVSSTECMKSALNKEKFDLKQFQANVNARFVTPKEEVVVLQEMDNRLKDDSLGEELGLAFVDLVYYKAMQENLSATIREWILSTVKRVCTKTTKLTASEYKMHPILHVFIGASVYTESLTQKEEEMFCEIMLSATKRFMDNGKNKETISYFVQKRIDKNVKFFDHDGNINIFLEHAKEVVEGMRDKPSDMNFEPPLFCD